MRPEDESFAASLPCFDGMAPESVKLLLKGAYLQRLPERVQLIRQGEPADFLHLIVEGQVETYAEHGGRQTTVSILGPSDSFILAAVFLDKVYLMSARTLAPSRLLLIPAADVRAVFERDPVFAHCVTASLAGGFRSLVKEVNNLKLRTSLERLANWILQQSKGSASGGGFRFPFDKKTLAARLGIKPEVLSRNFAALSAHGVTISRQSVVVKDRALLEQFAAPSPLIDDPET